MSTTTHDATETTVPENLAAIISHHHAEQTETNNNNNQGDVITDGYDVISYNDIISSVDVTVTTGDVIGNSDVTKVFHEECPRGNWSQSEGRIATTGSFINGDEEFKDDTFVGRKQLEKKVGDFGNITVRRHAIHLQQDQKLLNDIKQAMESILGVKFGCADFQESISDGVHLCNFLNCLNLKNVRVDPHKIHPGSLIKNKLQNATLFVDACLAAGLSRNEICTPYDIVEAKNLHVVCRTLQMLLECQP